MKRQSFIFRSGLKSGSERFVTNHFPSSSSSIEWETALQFISYSYFSPMKTHLFLLYCPIPPFSLRISSSMRDRSEQSQASHLHFPDSISVPVSYRDIVGGWIRKVFLFPFMFVPGPPSKSRRPDQTKS